MALACLLSACGREQVEIAEEADPSDAAGDALSHTDADGPSFPIGDGGGMDGATCGSPPPLSQCNPCPHGYVGLPDGGATCVCCP